MANEKNNTETTEKGKKSFFRRNFLSLHFLLYFFAALLIVLFSSPENFWDFDSSTLLPLSVCCRRFLDTAFLTAFLKQMVLLSAFYGVTLFLPGKKIRAFLTVTVLLALALYSLLNSYLVFRYSCPASEMVVVLNSSDMQEVREYFASLFLENKVFLFTGLTLLTAVPLCLTAAFLHLDPPENKKTFALLWIAAALLIYLVPPHSGKFEFWRDLRAVDFLYHLSERDFFLVRAAEIVKNPQFPAGSENALKDRTPVLGVMVLGESDCRRNHSLYGYGKNTDVKMAEFEGKDGFFRFHDHLSATSSTQHSVYFMFTDARIRDKYGASSFSLCDWFRAAGASVTFLSNQRAHGAWSSMTALLFAEADQLEFYSDGSENTYDRIHLLPHARKKLEQLKHERKPAFVTLHLMGSHYVQQFRIDEEWRVANSEKLKGLDHYDQTLVYTDEILWTLAKDIEAMTRPAFLLYMPDHSEQLNSSRSARTPDVIYYEIPVFLYCNAAYRNAFPDRMKKLSAVLKTPYQTDRAIWLLARLMDMPEKLIPAEDDLLSADFKIVPRYLEFGEKEYDEK